MLRLEHNYCKGEIWSLGLSFLHTHTNCFHWQYSFWKDHLKEYACHVLFVFGDKTVSSIPLGLRLFLIAHVDLMSRACICKDKMAAQRISCISQRWGLWFNVSSSSKSAEEANKVNGISYSRCGQRLPGGGQAVLQSTGSQRIRHNWATELNWKQLWE